MKKRLIIISIVINILLITILCNAIDSKQGILQERQNLMLDNIYYRNKDSCSMASIRKLTLSKNELKEKNEEQCKLIKDMKLSLNRVKSIAWQAVGSEYDLSVGLSSKDKIGELGIKYDQTKAGNNISEELIDANRANNTEWELNYNNGYIDISGEIEYKRNMIDLRIKTYDTLVQIIHRVPKKFLFFRFGTKAIRQEIISKNPHSNITYAEYIELK